MHFLLYVIQSNSMKGQLTWESRSIVLNWRPASRKTF